MIWLAIIGSVAGVGLGLKFRVYILFPATVFALVAAAGVGLMRGHGPGRIALEVLVIWIALQIGYLVGAVLAAMLFRSRVGLWRPYAHWWPWGRLSSPGTLG
jgi:hypothetical protein